MPSSQRLRLPSFRFLPRPRTDKIRQFDIRATADSGDSTLALAVECKNLRPNNPLLVSAVPRTPVEAFNDLLVLKVRETYSQFQTEPVLENASAYKPGEMVGKKTDQVGCDTDRNSPIGSIHAARTLHWLFGNRSIPVRLRRHAFGR